MSDISKSKLHMAITPKKISVLRYNSVRKKLEIVLDNFISRRRSSRFSPLAGAPRLPPVHHHVVVPEGNFDVGRNGAGHRRLGVRGDHNHALRDQPDRFRCKVRSSLAGAEQDTTARVTWSQVRLIVSFPVQVAATAGAFRISRQAVWAPADVLVRTDQSASVSS